MAVNYRDNTPFEGDNHTVGELAEAIRTKMYGVDVRESIAQAVEKMENWTKGASIGEIVATPTKVFDNLSALQSAYPNGTDGVMLTTDNGHKYFWQNNAWTDGGVYQSDGIGDGAILESKLANRLQKLNFWSNVPVLVDLIGGKIIIQAELKMFTSAGVSKTISARTITLPNSGANFLSYNPTSGEVAIHSSELNIPSGNYYLGYVELSSKKVQLAFEYLSNTNISSIKIVSPYIPYVNVTEGTLNIPQVWNVQANGLVIKSPSDGAFKMDISSYINNTSFFVYLDTVNLLANGNVENAIHLTTSPTKGFFLLGFYEKNDNIFRYYGDWDNGSFAEISVAGTTNAQVDWENEKVIFAPKWHVFLNDGRKVRHNTISGDETARTISFSNVQGTAGWFYIRYSTFFSQNASNANFVKNLILSETAPDNNSDKDLIYVGFIEKLSRTYDFSKIGQGTNQGSSSQWKGKKVACIGDSITFGDGGDRTTIKTWADYLTTVSEISQVTKVARNGSCITPSSSSDTYDFISRSANTKNQDAVIIFGGINDFHSGKTLGQFGDTDKLSGFYGALYTLLNQTIKNNPAAKILFCTPMKTTKSNLIPTYKPNSPFELSQNYKGNTQEDFVNAIKKTCGYFGIPVLDLYNDSNFNPLFQGTTFSHDGLHPNAAGQQRLVNTIGRKFETI